MNFKKIIAASLATVIAAATLTGCATNPNETVATLDGKNIKLGVANLWAEYVASMYDTYYSSGDATSMWATEVETDVTLEKDAINTVLDTIKEFYIVDSHMDDYSLSLTDAEYAAIDEAVVQFNKDNTSKAKDALGADDESLKEMLRLQATYDKVKDAALADLDRTVTDDESVCNTFSYVIISKTEDIDEENGVTEEKAAEIAAQQCESFINIILASTGTYTDENGDPMESFDYAANTYGLTVNNSAYSKSDLAEDTNSTGLPVNMLIACDDLDEGICSSIETDSAYYVFRLDKIADEDATASRTKSIISNRESEKYQEIYDAWEEEAEWTVVDSVVEKISLTDKIFNIVSANK